MHIEKIIIIYGGYLPGEKYGGPVTSLYNMTELLGDNIDIWVVCKNHDLRETEEYKDIKEGWNRVGKAKVIYLPEDKFNKKVFSKLIDEVKPNLIYTASIFSAKQTYPLFNISAEKNIPLLLAPRGELNKEALSKKKYKKRLYLNFLKFLKKYNHTYFQATSNQEKDDIKKVLLIEEDKIYLLPNIPAVAAPKKVFLKNSGNLKVCFVGRIVENKNLLVALFAVIKAKGQIIFDIYGPKEDCTYWDKCVKVIKEAPQNVKITYKGVIPSLKMKDIYHQYDCLISPTEFENYGQAIVEAMVHDVPVIISKGTTPWDGIETAKAGFVCNINSPEAFSSAISELCKMDDKDYRHLVIRLRKYCENRFDAMRLKDMYIRTFRLIKEDFDKL